MGKESLEADEAGEQDGSVGGRERDREGTKMKDTTTNQKGRRRREGRAIPRLAAACDMNNVVCDVIAARINAGNGNEQKEVSIKWGTTEDSRLVTRASWTDSNFRPSRSWQVIAGKMEKRTKKTRTIAMMRRMHRLPQESAGPFQNLQESMIGAPCGGGTGPSASREPHSPSFVCNDTAAALGWSRRVVQGH